jgi:hypothetical protein
MWTSQKPYWYSFIFVLVLLGTSPAVNHFTYEPVSIYWHVPVKERIAITETQITRNTRNETTSREPRRLAAPQTSIRRHPENANVPSSGADQLDLGTSRGVPAEEETTAKEQLLAETAMSSSIAPSIGKEWATPAMQKVIPQHDELAIDPQLTAMEDSFAPMPGNAVSQSAQSSYPGGEDEYAAMQKADAWLESLVYSNDRDMSEWVPDQEVDDVLPPTTMVTETHTAQGGVYKGCKCPDHQEIYSNWPTGNAELVVSRCMNTCMYCGKDFEVTAELRKHIRKRYGNRNLTVLFEPGGRGGSKTPGWTRIKAAPTRRMQTRATRSQSPTYGTNAESGAC